MKFNGLKHLFLEYKSFSKFVGEPTTALQFQSQAVLFLDAQCTVGFTGTLPQANQNPMEHHEFKTMLQAFLQHPNQPSNDSRL